MLARVTGILLDTYKVNILNTNQNVLVKSRGNVKKSSIIKVGDIIKLEKILDEYVITEITERKNDYIRPKVANIDYMFIVIACR